MIADGPSANRPPHIALELLLLSSRPLKLVVLGLALSAAGCDRQSGKAAQGEPSAAVSAGDEASAGVDRSRKGSRLPDFLLRDPSGKELRLASLKGKPVLLNLWATWCAPCVAELPQLDRLAGDREGSLQVVTVSEDMGQPEKVEEFLRQRGVARLPAWLDPGNNLVSQFGAETLPTTIYYDSAGREVWRITGGHDWTSAETARLLAEAD